MNEEIKKILQLYKERAILTEKIDGDVMAIEADLKKNNKEIENLFPRISKLLGSEEFLIALKAMIANDAAFKNAFPAPEDFLGMFLWEAEKRKIIKKEESEKLKKEYAKKGVEL